MNYIALGIVSGGVFAYELIAHNDPYGAVIWAVLCIVWGVGGNNKAKALKGER